MLRTVSLEEGQNPRRWQGLCLHPGQGDEDRLSYLLEASSSLRRISKDPGEFHRKQQ